MANFFGDFSRGFGGTFSFREAMGLLERNEDQEAEATDFQNFLKLSAREQADVQGEVDKTESSRAANNMSQELERQLSLHEPGSPERKYLVGNLPGEVKKGMRQYFLTADRQTLRNLSESVLDSDEIGTDQLKTILSNSEAGSAAITRATEMGKARDADPEGYAFQNKMRFLNGQAEKLQIRLERMANAQATAVTAAGKELYKPLIDAAASRLDDIRDEVNKLSSPQLSTFAQGTQNVTQMVDPSTGELIQIGAAEQPVYVQQRGQDIRAELGRAQSQAQFLQSEARQAGQFQLGEARRIGQFEREQATREKGINTALRKEFNALPETTNYKAIVPIVESAREATNVDTAAADLNLVYAAAKVMDPQSVVRESETAMVIQSGSPAQRFLGRFNYVVGGGRLTAQARKQLMKEIESRAKGHEKLYKGAVREYTSKRGPSIGSLPELGAGRDRVPEGPAAEINFSDLQ